MILIEEVKKAHLEVLAGNKNVFFDLLAEKEIRIAERDKRINELREELEQLRSKISRSKKPESEK